MSVNKIANFNDVGVKLFQPVLEAYGYMLEPIKIFELNGMKWSAHHVYINVSANLRIEIRQEPYYTDYGFSFLIYKQGTDQYNILYNVPHERQDPGDMFLTKCLDDLFSNKEAVDMISGKSWAELKHILIQR